MRILADGMQDLGAKAMMLQLAADWERLAELADEEAAKEAALLLVAPRDFVGSNKGD
jgi:hypothetical protein